jgi:type II secretory pathway pseudopilin PulG
VELMMVIAILAILSAIVLFTLNPSRLFNNFRDTRRVNDITTINKAIIFMEGWNTNGINYGISTNVYISLPDTSSTCSSYALPTLPTGYSYACKPTSTYKNSDSTG